MSITRKIFPPYLNAAYNPIIIAVDSDKKSQENFQFICDLFSGGTTTRIAQIKLPANPQGYGIFDIHRICENYIDYNFSPTSTGATWASNTTGPLFSVSIGEEYRFYWPFQDNFYSGGYVGFTSSTTQHYFQIGDIVYINQNPTGGTNSSYNGVHTITSVPDSYSFVTDQAFGVSTSAEAGTVIYSDYRVTIFTGLTSSTYFYVWNGALSHEQFRNYNYLNYNIGTGGTNGHGMFFTNMPSGYRMKTDSRAWFQFFCYSETNDLKHFFIDVLNGDGTVSSFRYNYPISMLGKRPAQFAVGPEQLNRTTFNSIVNGTYPPINSSVIQYSAYTVNSSSGISSDVKVIKINSSCSKFEEVQIVFLDRLGSYIPFTFELASTETENISREEFKKQIGEYNSSTNTFSFNSWDRGRTVYNTDVKKTFTVTSNWVTEDEADYLRELFSSPEAYWMYDVSDLSNQVIIPIVITNSTYQVKKRVKDKIFNVTMTFELAYNNEIQRS